MIIDHYGFSSEEISALKKIGVTEKILFTNIKKFDPAGTGEPISFVCIFHYIDEYGNFNDPPFTPDKKIAKALYNKLKAWQKRQICEYLESWENDFEDVDDDEDDEDE